MKKCRVIASCLVEAKMFSRIDDAENTVRYVFNKYFPGSDFDTWNREMSEDEIKYIFNIAKGAGKINVINFILEYWT